MRIEKMYQTCNRCIPCHEWYLKTQIICSVCSKRLRTKGKSGNNQSISVEITRI
jgi:hypothetical protein